MAEHKVFIRVVRRMQISDKSRGACWRRPSGLQRLGDAMILAIFACPQNLFGQGSACQLLRRARIAKVP